MCTLRVDLLRRTKTEDLKAMWNFGVPYKLIQYLQFFSKVKYSKACNYATLLCFCMLIMKGAAMGNTPAYIISY